MREQLCDLVPAPLGFGPLQLEGVGDGLTGDGQLQGQAPGVERRLRPGRAGLLRSGLQVVRMREEGGDGRGRQERLQGAWPLGIDRVQPVHRLVQPDAEFHLPAHAVEVGDLPRADPRGQIREEETVARRVEMSGCLAPPTCTSASMARPSRTCVLFQEGIEVSAGKNSPACPRAIYPPSASSCP